MKTIHPALAALALLVQASHSQVLINDAMEGYPTATASSVVSNAAASKPASWQTVVFSASGSVTTTAGIGSANGKTGRAAVINTNFSAAGNQWAGAILNSAAYNTPATLGTSLSNFQFSFDLRGTQVAAVTVEFLSYSASAQLTGSMAKTFTLSAANTYQTFSGDLSQNGWAPDSSKLAGAPLVLNAPRYGWTIIYHAEGNGGWGFDSGNVLDIDNVKLTASQAANTYLPTTYDANGFFTHNSGQSTYIGYKPDTYSHSTPISLFVWMHGCGGNAAGDMWTIAPPATRHNQSYIAISIGGRDGACWQVNADTPKVLAAIDDVARYFNINPRKVYLGGYSSGGNLTYRVGFENAARFAGLLVENSNPFTGTGQTGTHLMAAASWKINIAHLAHLSDTTFPIASVRTNIATLVTNGFPATLIEKAGGHYDADNGAFGTNYDLRTFLLPYLDAGWVSPPIGTPEIAVEDALLTNIPDNGSKSFGNVVIGSSTSVEFTIKNTGSADLTGLTISMDGANSAAFTVTKNPVSPVPAGGSTTFIVKFSPNVTQSPQMAAIHIASNDSDENPFDITLTGNGIAAPEISIEQPLLTNIPDNGSHSFGNVPVGTSASMVFTIKNTGGSDLTGLTITKDGANAGSFKITKNPVSPVPAGGSTTFIVKFSPKSSTKLRTAAIHIASNDDDENPFDITLTGTGTAAPLAAPSGKFPSWNDLESTLLPGSLADESVSVLNRAKGITSVVHAGGRKYLALSVAKSPGDIQLQQTVEVSSNLLDWFSGKNHTTVLQDDASFLKVRDNTPLAPGTKRFIRLKR